MTVLYWLESIRTPVLDFIMKYITYLGAEAAFLVIALFVLWCVDKREGYYLLFVGFLGTMLNQFLKLLFHIPRPWVRNPNFTAVEAAKPGATGYSFPSGHTQNATGTFGGLARWSRRPWLRAAYLALLVLVAFSRMYLGVHTPLDVAVSFGIGLVLVFALYPLVRWAAAEPKRLYGFLVSMLALSVALVLYANLSDFSGLDPANVAEGRKNSYSLLGALLGFLIAYPLEHKYIRYREKAVWWVQLLKLVPGLILLLAIKEGLKVLFASVGFTWLGCHALRYCAVVVFAGLVWPMTFRFLGRLSNKE